MTESSRLVIEVDSRKAKTDVDDFGKSLSNAETQGDKTTVSVKNLGNEANTATGKFGALRQQLNEALGKTTYGSMIADTTAKLAAMNGTAGILTAGLAGMAVGGIATATSALALMSIQSAKADAQLAVLAKRANVSTTNFQILEYAAAQLGMSQDGLAQSLADAQEKLGEFTSGGGSGEAADFFDALKNNTKMTDEQIQKFAKNLQGKDGVEVLQTMKDKLDKLGASAQEQRFIFESLGNDLGNLLPLFSDGGKLLDEFGDALKDAGVIKSKEAIEQSKILAAQTQAMNLQWQGAKNQLVTGFTPSLTSMAEALFASSENGVTLTEVGEGLGTVLKGVGTIALGTAAFVKVLGNGLGGLGAITNRLIARDYRGAKAIYDELDNNSAAVFDDFFMRMDKMWSSSESGVKTTGALTNAMLSLNNATDQNSKGLAINAKEAKEAEKAREKLAKEQENLNKLVGASALSGLRIKSQESISGGMVRGYTAQFAQLTQDLLGDSLTRFSSFNDSYHKGTNSKHATGNAFDFTVKSAKEAESAIAKLNEMALKYGFTIKTINEYADPSKRATGGHVHVSVLGFKGNGDALANAKAEAKIAGDSYKYYVQMQDEIRSIQAKYDTDAIARSKARDDEINRATLLGQTHLLPKIQERYTAQSKIAELMLDSELHGYTWNEEKKLEVTKQINTFRLDAEGKLSDDQKKIARKAYEEAYTNQVALVKLASEQRIFQANQVMYSEMDRIKKRYEFERLEIMKNLDLKERSALLAASYINQSQEESRLRDNAISDYRSVMGLDESPLMKQFESLQKMRELDLLNEDAYQNAKLELSLKYGSSYMESMIGGFASLVNENTKTYAVLFAAQKAFAVAQAMLNIPSTYSKTVEALSGIPVVGPYIAPVMGAAAAALQVAQAASIKGVSMPSIPGYSGGGFTGYGGKYEPAGTVHKWEGVLPKEEMMALGGPSGFEALRRSIRDGSYFDNSSTSNYQAPNFQSNRTVDALHRQQKQADLISESVHRRDMAARSNQPQSPNVIDNQLNVAIYDDREDIFDQMASAKGEKVWLYHYKRNKSKL